MKKSWKIRLLMYGWFKQQDFKMLLHEPNGANHSEWASVLMYSESFECKVLEPQTASHCFSKT